MKQACPLVQVQQATEKHLFQQRLQSINRQQQEKQTLVARNASEAEVMYKGGQYFYLGIVTNKIVTNRIVTNRIVTNRIVTNRIVTNIIVRNTKYFSHYFLSTDGRQRVEDEGRPTARGHEACHTVGPEGL